MTTPGPIKSEGNRFDGFTTFMISCMFGVTLLTVAKYNPFDLAVKTMEHKLDVKARLNVCNIVHAQSDTYERYFSESYKSGCLTTTRDYLLALTDGVNKKRHDEIEADFKAMEGNEWNRAMDLCSGYASAWTSQGPIRELAISGLKTTLTCAETYEEAKKLGLLENDDVQQ